MNCDKLQCKVLAELRDTLITRVFDYTCASFGGTNEIITARLEELKSVISLIDANLKHCNSM